MFVVIGIDYFDEFQSKVAIYNSELDNVESRDINGPIEQVISDLDVEFGGNLSKICVTLSSNKNQTLKLENSTKVCIMSENDSTFDCYSSVKLNLDDKILAYSVESDKILYNLFSVSKFDFNTFTRDLIKTYEVYSKGKALEETANLLQVFDLKPGEAHLFCNYSQFKDLFQNIEQFSEFFASITKNYDEIVNKNHYKSMIYGRFLIKDKKVQSLVRMGEFFPNEIHSHHRQLQRNNFNIMLRPINTYNTQTRLMGIDLGASRCVVSVSRNKRAELVKVDKEYYMPTMISFDEEQPIIGSVAMRKFKTQSKSVLYDIKQVSATQVLKEYWPFGICQTRQNMSIIVSTQENVKEFPMSNIYHILLQKLKNAASEFQYELNQGKPVNRAVITIPIFDDFSPVSGYLANLVEAAALTKIKIIDIIEETRADFLYFRSKYDLPSNQSAVVVDVGGGTSFIREYEFIEDTDGKRIIEHDNVPLQLDGRTIDKNLMLKLKELLLQRYNIHMTENCQMLTECEKIKCNLSFVETAYFDDAIEVKRQWFEETVLKPVISSSEIMKKIQELQKKQISKVFLVGGGCRIPYIQNIFKSFFGNDKIVIPDELELITATGALIHGLQILEGETETFFNLDEFKRRTMLGKNPENKLPKRKGPPNAVEIAKKIVLFENQRMIRKNKEQAQPVSGAAERKRLSELAKKIFAFNQQGMIRKNNEQSQAASESTKTELFQIFKTFNLN